MKKTGKLLIAAILLLAMLTTAACGTAATTTATAAPAATAENSASTDATTGTDATAAAGTSDYVFTPQTFKLGHALSTDHPYQKGAEYFAKRVNELTNGAVTIEVYPSSQLGGEASMLESLQMGTLDFCLTTTSVLTGFDDDFYIYDMPFLFNDDDHVFAVLDGEYGQKLLDGLQDLGIVGLSYWECGWFGFIYNGNPIEKYTDLANTTFRTMEATLTMSWFKALNSNPVPMAWSEVFTALQNGTVDGTLLPVTTIYFNSIYTVAKYYSQINVTYSPLPLCMSKEVWDSCSPELQAVLKQAADEAKEYERQYSRDAIDSALADMTSQGLTVITFTDAERQEWVDYMRTNVWPDLYKTGLITEEDVNTVLSYAK